MAYKYINKRVPLGAITISLADVKRIFERLSKHLEEEADRQIRELVRPPDQSEEEFAKQVAHVRKGAFRITITISGSDGQDLFGDSLELFDSPNLPEDIASIYMTNTVSYKGQTGREPPNRFSMVLDFSKPNLVDNNNPVSNPTPNNSNIAVDGDRDSWVAAISEASMGVLAKRKNGRNRLHAAFVYDIGLMLLALPFGLYLCWRSSGLVEAQLGKFSPFLSAVAYVYLMMIGLWLYRIMFGYTKWAFPTVELSDAQNLSKRHRAVWYVIMTGVISGAIIELWKFSML